jgi:uncharacterized membrane protein
MAVNLISISVVDAGGGRRAIVLPVASTETIDAIQSWVTNRIGLFDAVIGGVIEACTVQMALALPGGLKDTAIDDHLVDHGGLLSFSCAGTPYRYSVYVPTYLQTLIENDKTIPNTGATLTNTASMLAETYVTFTDKYANAFASFLGGNRVNRK